MTWPMQGTEGCVALSRHHVAGPYHYWRGDGSSMSRSKPRHPPPSEIIRAGGSHVVVVILMKEKNSDELLATTGSAFAKGGNQLQYGGSWRYFRFGRWYEGVDRPICFSRSNDRSINVVVFNYSHASPIMAYRPYDMWLHPTIGAAHPNPALPVT